MKKQSHKPQSEVKHKMPFHKILFSSTGRIGRGTFLGIWIPWCALSAIFSEILQALPPAPDEEIISAVGSTGYICLILVFTLYLAILAWVGLAINFKRWHDRGRSGGMVLINFIPIVGTIWSLVELGFLKGTVGPNRYGTEPVEITDSVVCADKAVLIAVLTLIPFAMGKYIEFNTPDPFDSGGYVYSAQRAIDGARIGVDDRPSAQMGTLLVNILGVRLFGFDETGPKLIQMILQAAALVFMFITMRKLFGTLAAAVGVIIASAYLSAPLVAKFGNVKEQHMIAFMVLGVCCFVQYKLSGKWWWAVLSGAALVFAPMFKETGVSASGAVGLFVILQPLLGHSTWKMAGTAIMLLLAGAILVVAPICVWLASSGSPIDYYPYWFLYKPVVIAFEKPQPAVEPAPATADTDNNKVQNAADKQGFLMKLMPAYVRDSWRVMTPEQVRQAKLRVFRWYGVLILPVSLAAGAVIIRLIKLIGSRLAKSKDDTRTSRDGFVLIFAIWWLLDMTFVWISPHSYEQYYLPLNASAAMAGGYLIAIYSEKARNAASRPKWMAIGALGLLLMIVLSWHVFFGVARSPHSGGKYRNPDRQRGYSQGLAIASRHFEGERLPWELLSAYIKDNSSTNDKIYVWGWVPGIYVQAQRMSPAPKAFEGTMHTLVPQELSKRVDELLRSFEKEPPKFMVDTYKIHFPWDRPPLELWPRTSKGFLPTDEQIVSRYEAEYAKMLRENISDPDEVRRFEVMKPFRDYVMKNYRVVRTFADQVLFQRK